MHFSAGWVAVIGFPRVMPTQAAEVNDSFEWTVIESDLLDEALIDSVTGDGD